MIVVDASALVERLLGTAVGHRVKAAIGGAPAIAPDLLDAEVAATLRALERRGQLTARRAGAALTDLGQAPIVRRPTRPLVAAAWALRHNLTVYDGVYAALAAACACPLVTTDARLARAPVPGVSVTLVG